MTRAAHILAEYSEVSELFKRRADKGDKVAATKALSTLAKLRRFINKPNIPLDNTEKRLLNLLVTQIRKESPSYANKVQSNIDALETSLSSYEDNVKAATDQEEKEAVGALTKEKDATKEEIIAKSEKEVNDLAQEMLKNIQADRENTYADILGDLRKIQLSGPDFNREKIDSLLKDRAAKQRTLRYYAQQKSNAAESVKRLKNAISLFKTVNNPGATEEARHRKNITELARLNQRVKTLSVEIVELQNTIKTIDADIGRTKQEAGHLRSAADRIIKASTNFSAAKLGSGGYVTLGALEKLKVLVMKKPVELARLDTVLNILKAQGANDVHRRLQDKVTSGEVRLTRYYSKMHDTAFDILRKSQAELVALKKSTKKDIKGKKSTLGAEKKKALELSKKSRQDLYDAILKELEALKSQAESLLETLGEYGF